MLQEKTISAELPPSTPTRRGTFRPDFKIKGLRALSRLLIKGLGLNGRSLWSNEFMQCLDPKITVPIHGTPITFRTGHGRLRWRALEAEKFERVILDWIDSFSSEDCFFDVGSNIGTYALYAASRGVRSYACEPEFNNLQTLYENIFLNKLQALCTPIPFAIGECTTRENIYLKDISKADALHSVGQPSMYLDTSSEVPFCLEVLMVSLDDLIRKFNLPWPSRLKIDVDGNELQVIRGARECLKRVKDVYLEFDVEFADHQEACSILESEGFRLVASEPIQTPRNQSWENRLYSHISR